MRYNMNDAQQQAFSFLVHQAAHIEPQAYAILYPEVDYASLIPVDTSANEWAKTIEFFSLDKVGKAEWFHHEANDMPRADTKSEKHTHSVEMAGIGYGYTLEELQSAMMVPNQNLSADRAMAARRAYEEFMYNLAFDGDADRGLVGLFNDSNVTVASAANTGTSASTNWTDKTGAQIIKDVNDALSGIHTASNTVEMADTVLVPTADFNYIASTNLDTSNSSNVTILKWLLENNVYTAHTGQRLTLRAHRGLATAGVGGVGRMVCYKRDPLVLKLHLPMPHRFLPPWQTGPIKFDVPGIFRTGGVEIRRPGAVRYVDGISGDATV